MAASIPEEDGFAQTGARGDERFIGRGPRSSFVQDEKIIGAQFIEAAGGGCDIVHENDFFGAQMERARERFGIQHPRQIDGMQTSIHDCTGDTETRGGDALAGDGVASGNGFGEKILDEFFKAGEIVRGKPALEQDLKSSAVLLEDGEVAFRSADVS